MNTIATTLTLSLSLALALIVLESRWGLAGLRCRRNRVVPRLGFRNVNICQNLR